MARTIESPGVEIKEIDLSLNATLPVGTKVLVNGFAAQGPTNELIYVSNTDEFNQIFFGGVGPTNAAERYFYHSCNEVLNSPATLLVTRLPYGSGSGTGFDGEYTALAYAMNGDVTNFASSSSLTVSAPVVITLTEEQYEDIKSGQITWSQTAGGVVSSFATLGNAGMVILNEAKTTINEKYEGYYIAICDNTTVSDNMLSGYNSIQQVKTLNSNNVLGNMPDSVLGFALTGTVDGNTDNISEKVETAFNYDFSNSFYDDSLIAYVFKLRTSDTANDPTKLFYVPVEKFVGSLESTDKRTNGTTAQLESFYLQNLVNEGSNYISMYVNPYIADRATINKITNNSKTLNPIGSYTPCKSAGDSLKYIGNVKTKLDRTLALAENYLNLDVDIVLDAGLSTIFTYTNTNTVNSDGSNTFDDAMDVSTDMDDLISSTTGSESDFAQMHKTIFDTFNNFCQNTRKDCMHISDPIRGIFVVGPDTKVMGLKSKNFSQHIYTPLKNIYSGYNSNYSATYANWIRKYDDAAGKFVWLPFSGFQAAIMARMDSTLYPWYAPFGLNNGIIRNITDIAVRPNQKQNDMLYRIGINPVVFFQGDGFVVWGQKTLQAKPSAFDRINVRRLFLTLERATMKVMRYFVGEPNSVFTRTRVNNVLKPIFDLAKNNEGVYDYKIICDENNNTPDVLDKNEMHVSIYLKPVRTAEFIIVTFVATRTDQNFSELTV